MVIFITDCDGQNGPYWFHGKVAMIESILTTDPRPNLEPSLHALIWVWAWYKLL